MKYRYLICGACGMKVNETDADGGSMCCHAPTKRHIGSRWDGKPLPIADKPRRFSLKRFMEGEPLAREHEEALRKALRRRAK